jgi:hypothetical protein
MDVGHSMTSLDGCNQVGHDIMACNELSWVPLHEGKDHSNGECISRLTRHITKIRSLTK